MAKIPPRPGLEVYKNNDDEVVIAQVEDGPPSEDGPELYVRVHQDDVPRLIELLKSEVGLVAEPESDEDDGPPTPHRPLHLLD
jgi:hypothetical protein